jgi:prephenate dehydrogenase
MASSGFRDTTRIASGDPTLGADMFTTNRNAVLKTLREFKASLAGIEKLIRKGSVDAIRNKLSELKDFRDSIYK